VLLPTGYNIFQTFIVQQAKCSWSDRARGASGAQLPPDTSSLIKRDLLQGLLMVNSITSFT
jgi:hypothetical protein